MFFLNMAFKLLFLRQNYLFRKISFWFHWLKLLRIISEIILFKLSFWKRHEKVNSYTCTFKDFYHKFAP